jgi:hypothetical protein
MDTHTDCVMKRDSYFLSLEEKIDEDVLRSVRELSTAKSHVPVALHESERCRHRRMYSHLYAVENIGSNVVMAREEAEYL